MRVLTCPSAFRLALGLLALFILAPAWAEDPATAYDAIKRASLKGIESLNVVVLAAKLDSGCHRVSHEEIETDVEARLERAGIPLAPDPGAYLFVSLASVELLKDLLCGFVVSVELQHVVRLVRDMRIMTFGMTWHRGGLGFASTSSTPEDLRRLLATLWTSSSPSTSNRTQSYSPRQSRSLAHRHTHSASHGSAREGPSSP